MLIQKAINSLEWMVQHFKLMNENDESFVEPSPQLLEAEKTLQELKEMKGNYLYISLNILPSFRRGEITIEEVKDTVITALIQKYEL